MLVQLLRGAAAGAVGTTALNVTTYLDMALRGRPASGMPAATVDRLTDLASVDLSSDGDGTDDAAAARREAIGALLGFATGLGAGVLYGLVRSRTGRIPLPAAGAGLGLTVMAGSDVPATALGLTDPRTWGASGWLADVVPHLVYGFATAAAYDALATGG